MNGADHEREERRLGRLETLSAWLGFWKPRDVDVPPVPKRKIAIGAAVLLVVLVTAAAVAIPAIDAGKDEGAAREARDAAETREAERRRLLEDQAAHHGRGRAGRDRPERLALVWRVRGSISADAEARVRARKLEGPILGVRCHEERREGARSSFDCTAITSAIPATGRNVAGVTGHPFVAVVDFDTGRYSWCKTNPPPGERVIPDPRDLVALPRECVL